MKYEMPTTDDGRLWDIWLSVNWVPAIVVADELGLFAALDEAPATADALAGRLGLQRRGVEAVLAMLASLGFLDRRRGLFQITDLTRHYLLPASPFHWGGVLAAYRSGPAYQMVRRAVVPADAVAGQAPMPIDAWEAGQLGPEQARSIARYMHGHSLPAALGAAANGDFAGVRRLLDVGGGSGCFAIAIAQRHPGIGCTVMDLPAMCAVVQEYVAEAEVADRVDTVAVDMFRQPWPEGYDALFFSNIFHDWDAGTCAQLAAKAFAVLPPGGRIYVHEILFDEGGAGPRLAAAFSTLMLGTRGKQYSFDELAGMLERAGFVDARATSTSPTFSLVSARKP